MLHSYDVFKLMHRFEILDYFRLLKVGICFIGLTPGRLWSAMFDTLEHEYKCILFFDDYAKVRKLNHPKSKLVFAYTAACLPTAFLFVLLCFVNVKDFSISLSVILFEEQSI